MSGKLQADPLFQGLTRTAMIFGVSYMYFVINFVLSVCTLINTGDVFLVFGVALVVHGAGYLICLREPLMLELFAIKMANTWKCKNRPYHGYTNSYDVY